MAEKCCERDHDDDGNCDRHPPTIERIACPRQRVDCPRGDADLCYDCAMFDEQVKDFR